MSTRDEMVLGLLWLARAMSWRYRRVGHALGIDQADLDSHATLTLLQVAGKYTGPDEDFRPYVSVAIKRRIWSLLAQQRRKRCLLLSEIETEDECGKGIAMDPADHRESADEQERQDEAKKARDLLRHLPERSRRIVAEYFGIDSGEPKTLRQIGKGLGLSSRRAGQLLRLALDRLRVMAKSDSDVALVGA